MRHTPKGVGVLYRLHTVSRLGKSRVVQLGPKGQPASVHNPTRLWGAGSCVGQSRAGLWSSESISGVWTPVFVLGEGTLASCGLVAMWTCVPCSQGHPAYFSPLAACLFPMKLLFPGTKAPRSPQRRLLDFRKRETNTHQKVNVKSKRERKKGEMTGLYITTKVGSSLESRETGGQ